MMSDKNVSIPVSTIIGMEQPLLRKGVREAIKNAGMEVVLEADSSKLILGEISEHPAELVILDCDTVLHQAVPTSNLVKEIKQRAPDTKILVLCDTKNEDFYLECMVSVITDGATGCLPINVSEEQFINTVQSIYKGIEIVSEDLLRKLFSSRFQETTVSNPLNKNELDVLTLASRGMSNKAISEHLSCSIRSVHACFQTIFSKMNARSRTEAIYKALKNEWIAL